jgi:tRNA G18 (ribose-2'-O)-methylase SpoU
MLPIDDPADPRVDAYRSLRARESGQMMWAEGPTVLERLLASPHRVRSVLLSTAAHERLAPLVVGLDAPVYVAPQSVVNAIVGFDLHRGTIAVADRPLLAALDHVLTTARRVLVLEGLNDAENLGAIARSARGLGADALVLDPTCADPWYRRTVRVSMGEVLHLPIVRTPIADGLEALAAAGFAIWALTPRRDADDIAVVADEGVPARLALVLGAEGPGLSDLVLAHHRNVRIPLRDEVDSLNVGHAAAAALAVVQSSTT